MIGVEYGHEENQEENSRTETGGEVVAGQRKCNDVGRVQTVVFWASAMKWFIDHPYAVYVGLVLAGILQFGMNWTNESDHSDLNMGIGAFMVLVGIANILKVMSQTRESARLEEMGRELERAERRRVSRKAWEDATK